MGLDEHRDKVEGVLAPLARKFSGFDPNTLTMIGFLLAGIAAMLMYQSTQLFLVLAFIAILLSSLFDALDGKVARLMGKTSKWGDFLDHVIDRYADMVLLGGVMFSVWGDQLLGTFAILGVLLTSYVGTQAQAVGVGRLYAGILGRAERLVLHMLFIMIQIVANEFTGGVIWRYTPFQYLLILFATVGNATAIQRIVLVKRKLRGK